MINEETRRKLSEAGRRGGKAKVAKGYSMNKQLAREAGKIGAKITNAKKRRLS